MPQPLNAVAPSGHTPEGGVLVGSEGARRRLVVYEDAQCPFCRRFEQACADLLSREVAAGAVAVEYRVRSFLGEESVRAANALALAAEVGMFDQLRREVFAAQPREHSGGFTEDDLLELGERAGITDPAYAEGVRSGRYADWVVAAEQVFAQEDPEGTPNGTLDGRPVDQGTFYDEAAMRAVLQA
jgi:hypothetical protein